MARDVDFNYTASDKTGEAAASVTRRMKKTGDQVKKDSDKISSDFAKGIVSLANVVSPKLAKSLTGAFESAAGSAPQLIGAGVALAAPLVAATLSGAIIGGAGIGAAGIGVALAAKNPEVQAAGKKLGASLLAELTSDAQVFVQPVLGAFGQLQGEADQLRDRFRNIFADSSQFVGPLVSGLTRGVDGITRGIESLVSKAGPVVGVISDGIGDLGNSVGDALEEIASNGPQAAQALHDVFSATSDLIGVTGSTISVLTDLYGIISYIPRKLSGLGNGLKNLIVGSSEAGTLTKVAAHGIADVGTQATISADAVNWYSQQIDDAANAGKNLFDSATRVGEALDKVTESAKANGKTLDANTEKGRANREVLSGVADALRARYDSEVQANGETAKSTQISENNRAALIRAARQLGATKAQAEAYAKQLLGIPSKKDTAFHAATEGAQAKVRNLDKDIQGVRGKSVYIDIQTNISSVVARVNSAVAGFKHLFAADNSFAFAATGQSSAEPARDVHVASTIETRINLDGRPFRAYTEQAIGAASRRDAWRQKVGRR